MLLRRSQDEERMMGRLLQGLQEGVESGGRQHVHLVDDKHLIFSDGRRDAHLVDQRANIIHRVVARRVQLMDVIGALLIERTARLASVASLALRRRVQAVDRLGEDTGTRGLSHTARATEQIGVRQLVLLDRMLQGRGQRTLPYYAPKGGRTIFPGRYDVILHLLSEFDKRFGKDSTNRMQKHHAGLKSYLA